MTSQPITLETGDIIRREKSTAWCFPLGRASGGSEEKREVVGVLGVGGKQEKLRESYQLRAKRRRNGVKRSCGLNTQFGGKAPLCEHRRRRKERCKPAQPPQWLRKGTRGRRQISVIWCGSCIVQVPHKPSQVKRAPNHKKHRKNKHLGHHPWPNKESGGQEKGCVGNRGKKVVGGQDGGPQWRVHENKSKHC